MIMAMGAFQRYPDKGPAKSIGAIGYIFHAVFFINNTAFLCAQLISVLETNKLVQVVAVHPGDGSPPAAGTVDVLPLVMQVDGGGNTTPHETVTGLPYFRLQGGNGAVIADPAVDEIGWVAVCDRDTSNVRSTLKASPPGSGREFSLADGIYLGGCLNGVPSQYVWFKPSGVKIVDNLGNIFETGPDGIDVTLVAGGDLRVNGTGFLTHVHVVTTAPGVTAPPTPGS